MKIPLQTIFEKLGISKLEINDPKELDKIKEELDSLYQESLKEEGENV
jgi:hypothetical protein